MASSAAGGRYEAGILALCCLLLLFCHGEAQPEGQDTGSADQRYLIPVFSLRSGASNQLIEFISAAVMARTLNRTLCLPSFNGGPHHHQLPGSRVLPDLGMHVGDRYNLSVLARFVPLASIEKCMSADACGGRLGIFYKLRGMHSDDSLQWETVSDTTVENREIYRHWGNPSDVAESCGSIPQRCMGVGGAFPGLRWRGAYLAVGYFLQHTDMVIAAAKNMRDLVFGSLEPYLAVHWRFWESGCHRRGAGLCFLRCNLGANPASPEITSTNPIWTNTSDCGAMHYGVEVELRDVSAAIIQMAEAAGVKSIWLATDGWLRRGGCIFIDELGNHMVSILEQEMCIQSAVFLGTGVSSWSVAVHRHRLAARRAEQLARERGWEGEKEGEEGEEERRRRDDLLVEDLLKDDYSAGVLCVQQREQAYHHFGRRERLEDDIDAWLDNMACEGREGKGGNCSLAICF